MVDTIEQVEEEVVEGEESAPEPSLRETIEKAYEEKSAEVDETPSQSTRSRDASGKFLPKDSEVAKPVEAAKTQTETPVEQQEQITPVEPPRGLNAQEAELFKQVPAELQKAYHRMIDGQYRTYSSKMGEIGRMERKYRDIEDAVVPYETEWAKAGVTPGQVLRNYLAWEQDFHQNPEKVIGELMAQKGLDLAALQAKPESLPNPEIQALKAEIEALKGGYQKQQESSVAEYTNQLNNSIESYRSEAGPDGKPLRPHFDAVYNHMIPIAKHYREANPEASEQQILDAAYKDAIYLHPQVRQQVLEQEWKSKQEEQQRQQRERVQRAKIAGGTLRGNPNGAVMVNTTPGSLRETIEKAWEDLS